MAPFTSQWSCSWYIPRCYVQKTDQTGYQQDFILKWISPFAGEGRFNYISMHRSSFKGNNLCQLTELYLHPVLMTVCQVGAGGDGSSAGVWNSSTGGSEQITKKSKKNVTTVSKRPRWETFRQACSFFFFWGGGGVLLRCLSDKMVQRLTNSHHTLELVCMYITYKIDRSIHGNHNTILPPFWFRMKYINLCLIYTGWRERGLGPGEKKHLT